MELQVSCGYSAWDELPKTPKASQIGDDEVGYDDTIDVTTTRRCKVYMAGYWCHKGDWCDRLHRFPKEDGVVCKHFKRNECTRDSRLAGIYTQVKK